jgi:Arc/MetJ family transcription regulator
LHRPGTRSTARKWCHGTHNPPSIKPRIIVMRLVTHHKHHESYDRLVRTTIRLDDDVAAAVQRLRRERHIGLSEAVNELARAGLRRGGTTRRAFRQRTHRLGLRVDVSNVAEALELLDELERAE